MTPSSVTLTWTASSDDTGVAAYRIFRDGQKIAETRDPDFQDTALVASTRYAYQVQAVDAAGNASAASDVFAVTTTGGGDDGDYPEWDPFGAYEAGDVVTHEGKHYVAVRGYTGYGDSTWITAPSLWQPIDDHLPDH